MFRSFHIYFWRNPCTNEIFFPFNHDFYKSLFTFFSCTSSITLLLPSRISPSWLPLISHRDGKRAITLSCCGREEFQQNRTIWIFTPLYLCVIRPRVGVCVHTCLTSEYGNLKATSPPSQPPSPAHLPSLSGCKLCTLRTGLCKPFVFSFEEAGNEGSEGGGEGEERDWRTGEGRGMPWPPESPRLTWLTRGHEARASS